MKPLVLSLMGWFMLCSGCCCDGFFSWDKGQTYVCKKSDATCVNGGEYEYVFVDYCEKEIEPEEEWLDATGCDYDCN